MVMNSVFGRILKENSQAGHCVCCLSFVDLDKALCGDCYLLHQKSFYRCEACAALLSDDEFSLCADCIKKPVLQKYTVCAVNYHSLTGELIRQLKYRKKFFTVSTIASLMSEHIMDHYQASLLPQVIIPVPLHYRKFNQRGFNQSELIAKKLASIFDIEVNKKSLMRIKATDKLENKSKSQRLRIMTKAFECQPIDQSIQHIALIDDVYTTGATTAACIKAIQRHNPKIHVDVWCYARTQ